MNSLIDNKERKKLRFELLKTVPVVVATSLLTMATGWALLHLQTRSQMDAQFALLLKQQEIQNREASVSSRREREDWLEKQHQLFRQQLEAISFEKSADLTNWFKQQELLLFKQNAEFQQSQKLWEEKKNREFEQKLDELRYQQNLAQSFWEHQQKSMRAEKMFDKKFEILNELIVLYGELSMIYEKWSFLAIPMQERSTRAITLAPIWRVQAANKEIQEATNLKGQFDRNSIRVSVLTSSINYYYQNPSVATNVVAFMRARSEAQMFRPFSEEDITKYRELEKAKNYTSRIDGKFSIRFKRSPDNTDTELSQSFLSLLEVMKNELASETSAKDLGPFVP